MESSCESPASQIVQDDIELSAEEILPAGLEVFEERVPVFEQAVKAAIEVVLGGEGGVISENVGHGTSGKPIAMEAELAPRIDETISNKGLKDRSPVGAFAAGR